jgi:putative thioredoxin
LAVDAGNWDEALEELALVPRSTPEWDEAERLTGLARFRRTAHLSGGEIEARRRLAAHPEDPRARLDLAQALAAKGDYREALEGLLALVKSTTGEDRERAREAMLDVLAALGDDELAREYRALLAAALW